MPTLLRRNLNCFYCGQRSSQKYSRGLRDWKCEKCEAINFLDENGQITDPPVPPTPQQIQYARSAPHRTSPDPDPSSEPLFCSTCLKNQHVYTQSLAEYLPPVTDPQYAKYEASYEEYKQNLEKRYPQVCAQCEPRARARIQAAGYAAKTDHLRRMMERTRRGSLPRYAGAHWRWILVTLGGVGWCSSIFVQTAWHLAGALLAPGPKPDELMRTAPLTWDGCIRIIRWGDIWRDREVERQCFWQATPSIGWSLVVALLTCWWNSKLKDRVRRRNIKIHGLAGHLWLQILMLVVRTAGWWLLHDTESSLLPMRAFGGAHAFMVIFLVASTIASLLTVHIDDMHRVLFSDDVGPLILDSDVQDSAFSATSDQRRTFQSQSASFVKPFPISNLAPIPSSAFRDPLTPPPDDLISEAGSTATSMSISTATTNYDPDSAMDWSPTTTTHPAPFQPRRSGRLSLGQQQRQAAYAEAPSAFGGPSSRNSPFYGTLPPRPLAPAAKLRNPHQPVFQRASDAKQENFFAQMARTSSLANADPYADNSGTPTKRGGDYMELAQPKWEFGGQQADTGLELSFGMGLSMKDEPAEVRAEPSARRPRNSGAGAAVSWRRALLLWGLPLAIAVALAALRFVGWASLDSIALHTGAERDALAASAATGASTGTGAGAAADAGAGGFEDAITLR